VTLGRVNSNLLKFDSMTHTIIGTILTFAIVMGWIGNKKRRK